MVPEVHSIDKAMHCFYLRAAEHWTCPRKPLQSTRTALVDEPRPLSALASHAVERQEDMPCAVLERLNPCPGRDIGAAAPLGAGLTQLLNEDVHAGAFCAMTSRVGMLVLHQAPLLSPSLPRRHTTHLPAAVTAVNTSKCYLKINSTTT